ncbi:acyltransferase [Calothrix sp. NIES-4071]|nr:acyltransferase [Calothrix sp. NIES-4071]BAZ55581.1 acyltransferase [Calothrix sp. NIES-4105]
MKFENISLTNQPINETSYNKPDALLILRGIACLMVVVTHCSPARNAIISQNHDISWLTFSNGLVAVWIFFCLSGYLMGKAFYTKRYTADTKGVIKFWFNRAVRICPLYYFAVFICTLFVYPSILQIDNWGYIIRLITFTYQPYMYSRGVSFNGALWSISTEMQFYLIVPFVYVLFSKVISNRKRAFVAIISIIFTVALIKLGIYLSFYSQITEHLQYAFTYWYAPLLTNLDVFLCGFLINPLIHYSKQSTKPNWKIIAVILLIILYLFTAHHLYNQELWGLPGRDVKGFRTSTTIFILQPLTALVTCIFIYAFEHKVYNLYTQNLKLTFAAILKNPVRALEIPGILSYGIYIWHMPIINRVGANFSSNIPIEQFYSTLIATIILSSILATLTYYLIEIRGAKLKTIILAPLHQ